MSIEAWLLLAMVVLTAARLYMDAAKVRAMKENGNGAEERRPD